ncbi:MAG TPA: plastocyanin/azurin family copper-binding protein [Longimicrobium sp.]|jgi:plastocyanin
MKAHSTYSFACAAFAALVAASSLAGCFSDRGGITATDGEELCTGTQPANVVRISDFQFSPAQVTVASGQEVVWVNCGPSQHSSTSDADVWDSNVLPRFAVFRRTFTQAGSNPYHCEPHPSMRATVVVQ